MPLLVPVPRWWLVALATVVGLVACESSNSELCSDGRLCSEGTVCDVAGRRCVLPERRAVCVGKQADQYCPIGDTAGRCVEGVCTPYTCGDGLITRGEYVLDPDGTRRFLEEECDGANLDGKTCRSRGYYDDTPGLRCSPSTCRFIDDDCRGRCGDRERDPDHEQCDGDLGDDTCLTVGFYRGNLGCHDNCTFDTRLCDQRCGDGRINGPELCDGAPPPGTCIDLGYDAGSLRCAQCSVSLTGCGRIDWQSTEMYERITDLWGDGETLVAVGQTEVHVFDGSSWTTLLQRANLSAPTAVWGVSGRNFWVGMRGGVARWDGAAWRDISTDVSDVRALWGSASDDVYAIHGTGMAHFDGTSWSSVALPSSVRLRAISGSGRSDVYAVGEGRTILHFDGARWSATVAAPGADLTDVWVSGRGRAFALSEDELLQLDGARWSTLPAPRERYVHIGGDASGDLTLVTDRRLWRYDGRTWSRLADLTMDARFIHALWVDGPTRVWLGELFAVGQFPGAAYQERSLDDFDSVWAEAPERTFVASRAGGTSTIERVIDGVATPSLRITDGRFRDILGFAGDDVYAAGTNGVHHFDGEQWQPVVQGDPIGWLWITPGGQIFGCGDGDVNDDGRPDKDPVVVYRDGDRWMRLPSKDCQQGWGTGPDDIYLLGDDGAQHWDGAAWTLVPLGPGGTRPEAVWGWARDDVYIIDVGWVVHFDGARWTYQLQLDPTERFTMVAANARDDVFVSSYRMHMMHFDGTRWAPVKPLNQVAYDMSATPSQLYFAGYGEQGGLRSLARTTRWGCRPREVTCDDLLDDDCDGLIDRADPDC
jgi:hypothetical protein